MISGKKAAQDVLDKGKDAADKAIDTGAEKVGVDAANSEKAKEAVGQQVDRVKEELSGTS